MIHFNKQNQRNNCNNHFQHGDSSVLDGLNYAINKTHLVSSGPEFPRNENLGISNFNGIGNINDSTNLSAPVSSEAGYHRGYQHAKGWEYLARDHIKDILELVTML